MFHYFKLTAYDWDSGTDFEYEYGLEDRDWSFEQCEDVTLKYDEEITGVGVFADDADIEGIRFEYESGAHVDFRANWDTLTSRQTLPGRLIGLKVMTGTSLNGSKDMMTSL